MNTGHELSAARPVVIVVDDDPAVCNSLRFSLEVEGFVVRDFSGGAELLKDAEHSCADCFVIDDRMPGMTGLEVVARLRERNISAPVILIVSSPTPALAARAARAGVSIVEKPLLGNVLLDRIHRILVPAIATDE